MIAAVRVRGPLDNHPDIENTLQSLGLEKQNQFVLLEDGASTRGMLKKAKDFIAYGEIDENAAEQMDLETGNTYSPGPPTGGYGDTRSSYGQGGILGNNPETKNILEAMI
nr:MAG: ribosomal protein L30/L7E [Candidatus Nanosalinarum sp. J07AB56]